MDGKYTNTLMLRVAIILFPEAIESCYDRNATKWKCLNRSNKKRHTDEVCLSLPILWRLTLYRLATQSVSVGLSSAQREYWYFL